MFAATAKFMTGYLAVQAAAGFVGYGLAKLGLIVGPVQSVLSIVFFLGSCFLGCLAMLSSWSVAPGQAAQKRHMLRLQQLSANLVALCLCLGMAVFAFHLMLELAREHFFPAHAAEFLLNPAIRAALMALLVALVCHTMAGPMLKSRCTDGQSA